ncbi:MAG: Gfo/Idh/MocA family oxidoreductase, partial [Halanaerobium sp.]
MAEVKVGIIGIGNMGTSHAEDIFQGKVQEAVLTAVCDLDQQRLEWAKSNLGQDISCFSTPEEFYAEA